MIWHHTWLRTAAAVFVVGLATLLYDVKWSSPQNTTITYQELVKSDSNGLIEQTNNSNKPQLITLSDASSVLLQPNSKLSYPKIFTGKERKVYLSGEGFLKLAKIQIKLFMYMLMKLSRKYMEQVLESSPTQTNQTLKFWCEQEK